MKSPRVILLNGRFCVVVCFVFLASPLIEARSESNHPATGSEVALKQRRLTAEPLEALGTPDLAENRELDIALEKFSQRSNRDDFSPITDFLEAHPRSPWRWSLLAQLGDEYCRTGHFSKALAAWESVWDRRSLVSNKTTLPLTVQRAGASLANMYARLGRMEPLRPLLAELEAVPVMAQYAWQIKDAKEGLWTMDHRPEIAFRCGPLALDRIRAWANPTNACHPLIFNSRSTTNGICLRDVAALARSLGMSYQIAFRSSGAKIITPSVIHWKVGHYAAVVREAHGLFLTQDPTFWNDTWASSAALDEEASGYFLVPAGPLPEGWRMVSEEEALGVWGKGTTGASDSRATRKDDKLLKDDPCHGMATWDFNLMLVNQRISDMPIGYQPPVGPGVFFTFTMSAQDNWMRQFASWWGTTLGENWSCNWNSFIKDDPQNPSGNLDLYDEGGWLTFLEDPSQPGVFRCQFHNPGYLTRLVVNGIDLGYTWNLPDGSKKIYGHPYAAGTTGFSLLTAVVDATGNAVTLEYDVNFPGRIMAIVDALGQRTTLEYGLTDPGFPPPNPLSQGNSQFNWQVTRITDPFGRTATFQYQMVQDGSPPAYFYYLTNITDVAGLSSQMVFPVGWANNSFPVMPTLTTPYGTTQFRTFVLDNRNFGFEITEPDGNVQRLQYCESSTVNVPHSELQQNVPHGLNYAENEWLFARNVYYWDKKAYAEGFLPATNDYSKAVIYHFTHAQNLSACGPLVESLKRPLENRVWFNYPGQGAGWFPGTDDHPCKIGRVLDDGSTQLWQFGYNSLGKITNSIDPVGRTFSFVYDSSDIDLLEVRQTRGGQNELLWKAAYNNQHLPIFIWDASGRPTTFAYNSRGQVLSIVNARNETNSFGYDANGYLTFIDGPLPGSQDRDTFTYDAAGRIRTATDQDGYTLTLDYDDLDRLTKVTFPDGTFQQVTYDRLRPGTFRDRLGRVTTYAYNNLGQLASIEDPLGRLTRFQWCRCGELESLIDPLGRVTSWQRDLEGRITARQYADGSTVRYDYEHTTGRLRQIRDERNQITQFDYFVDDSLRKQSYLNAVLPTPSVEFTYDPAYHRVVSLQDGQGVTTYTYNPIGVAPALGAGRLRQITGPWANDVFTFTYDEIGRVVSRDLGGVGVRRDYDSAGRLVQLTNVLGRFTLGWEGGSARLSSILYPNGQHTQYSYFPNAQDQLVKGITNILPNNSVQSEFNYHYDSEGKLTNWTQLQAGALTSWTPLRDVADRLLGLTVTQNGGGVQNLGFTYDPADNLTSARVDGNRQDFYVNALNELVCVSNNVTVATGYEWDAENRLAAITNGTHRSEFSYDGLGRRARIIEKENGLVIDARRYVWCGSQLCEERDDSGTNVLKRYSSYGVSSTGSPDLPAGAYYFTFDHLSSVREMDDAAGALRGQFVYSPFGTRTRLAGDLEPGFGFTGHFMHPSSGLLLAEFRAYDPRLGRWLSRDPAGEAEGLNRYAYVRNDPLDLIDATGFGDGPAAAKLVNQTKSGQDVQMAIETAKGIQKIAVTTKSVIQKGASATLDEEIRKRGEKALDKVKPAGDMKEIEPIYDENKKTADTIQKGTLPFKDAWKKAIDATRVTPCDPETKGPPPKTDAPSKHFWDSWFDSAPDPSQPQALDPKAAKQVESSNNQQNAY